MLVSALPYLVASPFTHLARYSLSQLTLIRVQFHSITCVHSDNLFSVLLHTSAGAAFGSGKSQKLASNVCGARLFFLLRKKKRFACAPRTAPRPRYRTFHHVAISAPGSLAVLFSCTVVNYLHSGVARGGALGARAPPFGS